MVEALPCIVCDRSLSRVDDHCDEAQPYEGTNFTSHGHYGSTAFDPIDGSFLAINICDFCLQSAAWAGQVVCGRSGRPVMCEMEVHPGQWMVSDIGYESVFNYGLVQWKPGMSSYDKDDVCRIYLSDIEAGLSKNIHVRIDLDRLKKELREGGRP